MDDVAEVWREYKKTGDPILQEELVVHYQPLVKKLALGVLRKLRAGTELDELVADGLFGLVRAIEGFEPERGYKFQTYATPVVRGAIYNGLRRMDWLPERTRSKARAFQRAVDKLQQVSGRPPTEEDIAEELKMSAEEVYDLIANLGCMYMLSLDQPIGSDEGDATMGDLVEDAGSISPEVEVEFSEERDQMREALASLPEREKILIEMHYFEGVTFEAISRMFDVSKQRISQMHQRAVRRLRETLKKEMGDDDISPSAMHDFTV
ncbi:MAG: FliA/WhiG family RNA polymerase sigma factor [Candidatus Eremiobacteraeota bacterium]|nr:FliA/WhiG family RNA polymerase sigma factor [Candidatus Eremiobacteraeota bacterium]